MRTTMIAMAIILSLGTFSYAGQKPDDLDALADLKTANVIYDVRVADLEKLIFNLELFSETLEGLSAQGVSSKMVVAFRGPGVKLLTSATISDEALLLIRSLKKKGVRFEVCAVAMRVFKVDTEKLIPEARLVANVFNSLIGYQNKGYAMIAIN